MATTFFNLSDDQIDRLRRKSWGHGPTNMLAQELYSLLQSMAETPANQTNPGRGGFLPEDIVGIFPPPGSLPSAFPYAAFAIVREFVNYNTYNCDIYLKDPTDPATLPITRMPVKQYDIDSLEVIPNGTGTPCILHVESQQSGTKLVITSASMQVPVYLEIP